MFLADTDILTHVNAGNIKIDPFEPKYIQSIGYDLRLHKNFRLFSTDEVTHIDVKEKFDVTKLKDAGYGGSFVIHPGQFVLGATHEKITLGPNIAGILEGRSSLARIGIIIHATAGLIPPGVEDLHITFEMTNISNIPVKLYVGMRVAQLVFVQTSSPVTNPYGSKLAKSKYQGQEPPTASRIWEDFEK